MELESKMKADEKRHSGTKIKASVSRKSIWEYHDSVDVCMLEHNAKPLSQALWLLLNYGTFTCDTSLQSAAWIWHFLICFHFKTQVYSKPSGTTSEAAASLLRCHLLLIFSPWGLKPQMCFRHEAKTRTTLNCHSSLIWLFFTSKTIGHLPTTAPTTTTTMCYCELCMFMTQLTPHPACCQCHRYLDHILNN